MNFLKAPLTWIIIGIAMVVCVVIWVTRPKSPSHPRENAAAIAAALEAKKEHAAAELRAEDLARNKEEAALLALTTGDQGEGSISPLTRQLRAYPAEWGFKGDTNNKAAVKAWAEHQATVYAVKDGRFDPRTGAEVREYYSKTTAHAYMLVKTNGIVHIQIYSYPRKLKGDPASVAQAHMFQDQRLPVSLLQAKFLGWPGGHVPAFEYVDMRLPG